MQAPSVTLDGRLVWATAALLGVGLIISGLLTWDHQRYLLDPDVSVGLCRHGGGCEISRTSRFSEVPLPLDLPGLPLSLMGWAAYLAAAFLLRRGRAAAGVQARALLVALTGFSTLVSVLLALLSLRLQGALCPWCTGLYAVNLALLVLAWRLFGEGHRVWFEVSEVALTSRAMVGAAVAFLVALTLGYAVYAAPLFALGDRVERAQLARAAAILTEPVTPLRIDGRPSKGPAGAAVYVVEFADFQCPHCGRLYETVDEIRARHPESVHVTLLHFPLDSACNPYVPTALHPGACLLARAGECAHLQGRFSEMAPRLFGLPSDVSLEDVLVIAGSLKMDREPFQTCLEAPSTLAAVRGDIAQGHHVELRATPTFFINGRMVEGVRSAAVVEAMVQAVLRAKAAP